MLHTFAKEYTFEDKTYTEIDIPLEKLEGNDMELIQQQWRAAGNIASIPVLDMSFCARCAAAAAHLPLEFFEHLPAREYMWLTQKVSNFFLVSD